MTKMETGRTRIEITMAVAIAMAIVAAGCAKEHEHDADVDPGADWSGDVTTDQPDTAPDVPADTVSDTPTDTVADTSLDTPDDAAVDTPAETADTPADGVVQCRCADAGVVLVPDAGCSTWPDATECTGWHSVIDPDGDGTPALTDLFDDGSQHCAYGCCITIQCP
mgnify:CR=1 FL=1